MRTLFTLIATTSLIPACTSTDAVHDELGEETALDGEAGKADSADAFTYLMVTSDPRACSIGARCGGFFVARPNRSTTDCGNGSMESLCYVDRIDWTATAMPESVAQSYQERLREGESLLIRGEVAATTEGTALDAAEIWLARSETGTIEDGVFVLARTNDDDCDAPCANITESRLNSNLSADIQEIDFSESGASPDLIRDAEAAVRDGIIVVGYRYYFGSDDAKGRTATQFYTRAWVPLR